MLKKSTTTILQVCPQLNSGGIERGTVDMAIAVKKAGFHSLVACADGHLVAELTQAGVTHIPLPLYLKSPYGLLKNSQCLRKIMLDWNVQLVHARSRAPILATQRALKTLHIPLVTSCHSPHGMGFLNLKKIYNRGLVCGDRIIAISDFIAHYLTQQYAFDHTKLRTIYRGIDMDLFNPSRITQYDPLQLKQQHAIATHKKIILLPGRITRWKGHDIFIKALANVLATHEVHGVIVGRVDSADFSNELHTLIRDLNLREHVTFIDECFDMPPWYALADITLSSSRKPEAFGRVAVEAQAMRSLVIATELGAATETVIAGKTGFLIAPDNVAQLTQAIQTALDLPLVQKNKILDAARQHVEAHFTKEQMLQKTLAVYEECLQGINHTR